jgi:hypothetical protein
MRLEMSGFIQKDQFDLNSYLTYLFNKLNEQSPKEENKEPENFATAWRKKTEC